jgi:hypothetical protein
MSHDKVSILHPMSLLGTSKAYAPESLDVISTFGFRGEGSSEYQFPLNMTEWCPSALASTADLSCLEISSRTSRSRESWSIILKVCTSAISRNCGFNGLLVLSGWKEFIQWPVNSMAKRAARDRSLYS